MILSKLKEGQCAIIEELHFKDEALKKLHNVGFCQGAAVKCVKMSRRRGIAAYEIRGAVIAIRIDTAARIACRCVKI